VGRKVDVDDLVGAAEIASRLGVKRPQVVHEWRKRHPEFPEPVATLSNGLIWDWRDVDRWARATGRSSND
jgi:predicted DNA-binding transcriptional regulator AlpA